MTTTVSTKYQIVIPKAVRKRLDIQPGQKVFVEASKDGSVIIRKVDYGESGLSQYVGIINTSETEWGKSNQDASNWLRHRRDTDWS